MLWNRVEHNLDRRRRERSELWSDDPPPHGNAAWRGARSGRKGSRSGAFGRRSFTRRKRAGRGYMPLRK